MITAKSRVFPSNFLKFQKKIFCDASQSYSAKKIWEAFKDITVPKPEVERDNFQSWAEFENRGFIKPEYMRSWIIEKYGNPKSVLQMETVDTPMNKYKSCEDARRSYLWQGIHHPNDVLIKVHAASLNPIDIRLCEGYGANYFNFRRNIVFDRLRAVMLNTKTAREILADKEFPLILGRDFSGTVVDVGTGVYDIQVGEEVFGAIDLFRHGSLSDYVLVNFSQVVQRPVTLSHVEAASIPYVGLTVASALRDIVSKPIQPKHALVLGGSGGVGTFAIQYLQAYGYTVTVTCSSKGVVICNRLGATCIDYTSEDVDDAVKSEKFSLVFDPIGAASPEWADRCLVNKGSYVSLRSPVLELTDKYGLVVGSSNAGLVYVKQKLCNRRINTYWAFFKPDRQALLEIARIIDAGLIKPVVNSENVFGFEDVPKAFALLSEGHTKGKIVINVSELPEAVLKSSTEKIIHL